ncbi:hypothetical protein MJO28_015914 [Puccinia striiformis f. sp. tritici]|uniref:Uncharacterized protein n=1 Tax=Puccinia striiformis f. sp. tritici TaxID=168172 RepID=A0ACC0DQ10_9BASI|nr:hypothetical protein MJO28_015914 [Puccinia striiformis f. sp. tritici]
MGALRRDSGWIASRIVQVQSKHSTLQMFILAVPLRLWILTVVSSTLITNLESGIWDECRVEHKPPPAEKLLKACAAYPIGGVLTPYSPQPSQSSHSHLLYMLGPQSAESPLPPVSAPLQKTKRPREPPLDPQKVQISAAQSASSPPLTPVDHSPSNHPHKRLKQGHFDLGFRVALDNILARKDQTPPIGRKIRQPAKRRPERVQSTTLTQDKPNQPRGPNFTPRGRILLAFLKETYEHFKTQLHSRECDVGKLRERDPNPNLRLPIVVNQCETKSLKVIRVIRQLTGKTQRFVSFTALYKALIGWIYERHEEILNRHDLPAYVHRMQQAKLISWLDHQIFEPQSPIGLPIMGSIDCPGLFIWERYEFGPIQSDLIYYFAQDENNNVLVPDTSSHLVNKFYADNESDYVASNYQLEASIDRSTSPDFEIIQSFLIDSVDLEALTKALIVGSQDEIVLKYIDRFQSHLDEIGLNKMQPKTPHPKLPVALYFVNKDSDMQVIRVVNRQNNNIIANKELLLIFRRFIKAISFFHQKVHSILEKGRTEYEQRSRDLFEWLHKSITKPTDSLCVLGSTEINGSLAPWEDITNGALNLFGQVQLELIEFFSGDHTNPNQPHSAVSIICFYYQEHYPNDFEYLTRLSKIHNQLL